jgi:hypothetical protein
MKPTALGDYVGVCLCPDGRTWLCVAFNSRGNWQSSSWHSTQQEAQRERAKWRRHHARMAAERKARSRK